MDKRIAVLVVTYNRKKYLKENIEAVLNQSYSNLNLIICDNNSTDGTGELVEKYMDRDKRIKYFNTGENLGGAGGFNYGLKYVYGQEYDYCWIMDDDAVPEKDALKSLTELADRLPIHSFSFLASTVLWTDHTPCYMNKPTIETEKIYKNLEFAQNGLVPIESCSFVGCFVDLHYGRMVGLPIKEFFIYGDDSEYTLRLSEKCQGFLDTGSIIIHKMGVNAKLGIAEAPEDRIERYVYDYRNQVYISRYRKQEKRRKLFTRYLKESAKVLLRSKGKKTRRIMIIWKGYREGKNFCPEIEIER